MADRWGGLGVRYRKAVGMRGAPCALRLARASGYQVRPVQGQVCFARIGTELLVDASSLETQGMRGVQADIATVLAAALLERDGHEPTERAIAAIARELLIDEELLLSDWIEYGADFEAIERRHPRVPRAWLADALEQLEEPASNVVPLRRVAPRLR